MKVQEFKDIFNEIGDSDWEGCNIFQGLQIINKYITDEPLINKTSKYMVHSVQIKKLTKKNIIKEDIIQLKKLNWSLEDDCLACFV